MKASKTFTLLTLFSFLALACNKDETNPLGSQQRIVIKIEDEYTSTPNKVSVFFKVEYADGSPVAGLKEDDFAIYEQGRNDEKMKLISQDEADRIISDNAPLFSFNAILLLDLSGSVRSKIQELKDAANQFVENALNSSANSSTNIGIWWFDGADKIHPLINFTNDKTALTSAINGINSSLSNDKSTDLFGAMLKSTDLAESVLQQYAVQEILAAASIIVFTDGTDQAARYTKEAAINRVGAANRNISFYTIGLGNEIDENILKRLGKTSFVFAEDTDKLAEKFTEIAGLVNGEANSYYLFQYCTPKRDGSGVNKLRIEVNNGQGKGSKDTSFDATGFVSGVCALE